MEERKRFEEEEFVRMIKNSSNQEILSFFETTKNLASSLMNGILFDYSFRYKGNFLHYCCYTVPRNEIVLPILQLCIRNGHSVHHALKQVDRPYRRMAIHYAAWRGLTEVVEEMICHLSDQDLLKKEDHFGWSLLHWATFRNQSDIVRLVLRKRGDLHWDNIRDKKGKSILGLAEQYGFNDLAALISEAEFQRSHQTQQEHREHLQEHLEEQRQIILNDSGVIPEQLQPIEIRIKRLRIEQDKEKDKGEDEQNEAEPEEGEGQEGAEEEGEGQGEGQGTEEEEEEDDDLVEERSDELIRKLKGEIERAKLRITILEKENQNQKEELQVMKERERQRKAEVEQLLQKIRHLEKP